MRFRKIGVHAAIVVLVALACGAAVSSEASAAKVLVMKEGRRTLQVGDPLSMNVQLEVEGESAYCYIEPEVGGQVTVNSARKDEASGFAFVSGKDECFEPRQGVTPVEIKGTIKSFVSPLSGKAKFAVSGAGSSPFEVTVMVPIHCVYRVTKLTAHSWFMDFAERKAGWEGRTAIALAAGTSAPACAKKRNLIWAVWPFGPEGFYMEALG